MSPARTIIALWIAWLLSWALAAPWSSRSEKVAGLVGEIYFRILLLIGSLLLFVLPLGHHEYALVHLWRLGPALRWMLVAIAAAGFLLTWWARIRLGRLWSHWGVTRKPGHHVVDTGPYRFVRHPIYTGLLLAAFATAVEKGTSYALLGAAIITLAFYLKVRVEERFLRAELGEAYVNYARRTAGLVPFIGRK